MEMMLQKMGTTTRLAGGDSELCCMRKARETRD
jgi:hypothetical protein